MVRKTEYLVKKFNKNLDPLLELRVPKGVDLRLLLERLICRDIDDETLVASCLRKNMKRAYDPFQIVDMRDDYRRDNAKAAIKSAPNTDDPIGVYNRARQSPILLGKALLFAGKDHDYSVFEVEAHVARSSLIERKTP